MSDRNFWQRKLQEQRFISHAIIDGQPYVAKSRKTCPAINPASNTLLAEVTSLQTEDIDIAVASARRAFTSGVWSGLAPQERKRALLRLGADPSASRRAGAAGERQHGETGQRCAEH